VTCSMRFKPLSIHSYCDVCRHESSDDFETAGFIHAGTVSLTAQIYDRIIGCLITATK